jgi:hypothetical protein
MAIELSKILKADLKGGVKLHDKKVEGVKSSKESNLELGKDPAVDYDPKSKGDRDFVAKHKVEKHEDRVGNKKVPYEAEKGEAKYPRQKEGVYESTGKSLRSIVCESVKKQEKEEAKCNYTMEGTACPVHGKANCASAKMIKEKSIKEGAKVDRMAKHIKDSEVKAGHSKKKAESIAWATLNKRGMLEHSEEEAVDMIEVELKAIANRALHLAIKLKDSNMEIEPWVQAKIAEAKQSITSVHDYMSYGDHNDKEEEDEESPEGHINMPSNPINTLPNFSRGNSPGVDI